MGMDFYKKEAEDQRSPWVGAGIGAGGGGLLAAALGYIYGHRGRWLAYDTLTGGLAGGAAGYAIEASNKNRLESDKEEGKGDTQYWGSNSNPAFDKEQKERRKEIIGQHNKAPETTPVLKAGFLGDLDEKGTRAYNVTKKHSSILQGLGVSDELANAIARWTSIPQRTLLYATRTDDGRKKLSPGEMLAAGLTEDPNTESGYRATNNPVRDLGTYALEKSIKEKLRRQKKAPDISTPYDNMMDAYLGN